MLRFLARTIAIDLSILCCVAASGKGQNTILDTNVSVPPEPVTMQNFAISLGLQGKVHVGVELVPEQAPLKVSMLGDDSRLRAVLDSAVGADARYRWKQDGDSIDIFPKVKSKSVFDVVIKRFQAREAMSSQMMNALLHDEDVTKFLAGDGISAGLWIVGSISTKTNSITVRNETLRSVLNRVVESTDQSGWSAFYVNEEGKTQLWFQFW